MYQYSYLSIHLYIDISIPTYIYTYLERVEVVRVRAVTLNPIQLNAYIYVSI